MSRRAILPGSILLLLLFLFASYKIIVNKAYIWLPAYLGQEGERALGIGEKPDPNAPVDILFLFADHFEPDSIEELQNWILGYPRVVRGHADSDGRPPRHTWFFARESLPWLEKLNELVRNGYGEVELHIHHAWNTSAEMRKIIQRNLDLCGQAGALVCADNPTRHVYAFVHGKWSLDNSRGGRYCGVNDELRVLKETGCYADFTFPSHHETQPHMVNQIYYAKDDPNAPKSYDRGIPVTAGRKVQDADLMIFTGPMGIRLGLPPRMENGAIEARYLPTEERVDFWIHTRIHVLGQPNWIFIKVYTHGASASNASVVLGDRMNGIYSYLESHYNDGNQYRLHYVSAREAYNIVKAAEDGKTGNPYRYRDYRIGPYRNMVGASGKGMPLTLPKGANVSGS